MSEWFVRIAGSILGPYDAAELSNMARTGRLGPLDQVSKSRNGKWVEAHYVQGLVFEEAEADLPLSIESEVKYSPSRKQYDKKRFRGRYECGRVELGPTLLHVGLIMNGNGDAHIALFMEDQEEREKVGMVLGRTEWRRFLEIIDEAKSVIAHMKSEGQIDDLEIFG